MSFQIKIKRDTATDFETANTVLANGEFSLETDTGKMKVGNGSTAYNDLQFVTGNAARRLYIFEATTSVYLAGGTTNGDITEIHKMPVASQDSWSDIGDLLYYQPGKGSGGFNDESGNGYVISASVQSPTKVVFASDSVSSLPSIGSYRSGAAYNGNQLAAYWVGGNPNVTTGKYVYASGAVTNTIPGMGITTNSSDPSSSRSYLSGAPSGTFAFSIGGGNNTAASSTRIEKLNMSTEAGGSIDVGDLTIGTHETTATAGETHAYSVGGRNFPDASGHKKTMDKIAFATDGNATDIGDLVIGRARGAATSSTSYGFLSGGQGQASSPYSTASATTERWPFASDSSSSNIPASMPSSSRKNYRATMND